eukprot:m.360901 g.360901  ORF g.360901 m.360901 type:complete len:1267 (-) comp19221_c0_seq1:351-4151(-)
MGWLIRWPKRWKAFLSDVFYWHGLLIATNPVQTIIIATVVAFALSYPSLQLFMTRDHWRPHVWQSPSLVPLDGSITQEDVPDWLSTHNHTQPLHSVIQIVANTHGFESTAAAITQLSAFASILVSSVPSLQRCALPTANSTSIHTKDTPTTGTNPVACVIVQPSTFQLGHQPVSDQQLVLADVNVTLPNLQQNITLSPSVSIIKHPQTWLERLSFHPPKLQYAVAVVLESYRLRDAAKVYREVGAFLHSYRATSTAMPKNPQMFDNGSHALSEEASDGEQTDNANFDGQSSTKPVTFVLYRTPRSGRMSRAVVAASYLVMVCYVYVSLSHFGAVKSRFGLGVMCVAILILSLTTSIGVCRLLGVIETFSPVETVPFVIMVMGLDKIGFLTACVVKTPANVAVRFRIAEGLRVAGVPLLTSLIQLESFLILGFFSSVPQFQDFSIVACAAVLSDYSYLLIAYVAVLTLDKRRMELTGLELGSYQAEEEVDTANGLVSHQALSELMQAQNTVNSLTPSTRLDDGLSTTKQGAKRHSRTPSLDPSLDSTASFSTQVSSPGRSVTSDTFTLSDRRSLYRTLHSSSTSRVFVTNAVIIACSVSAALLIALLVSGTRRPITSISNAPLRPWRALVVDSHLDAIESAMKGPHPEPNGLKSILSSPYATTPLSAFYEPLHLRIESPSRTPPLSSSVPETASVSRHIQHIFQDPESVHALVDLAGYVVILACFVLLLVYVYRWAVATLFGQRYDVDSLADMSLLNISINTVNSGGVQLECFAVNEQQNLVTTVNLQGSVKVWDMETERLQCVLRDVEQMKAEFNHAFVDNSDGSSSIADQEEFAAARIGAVPWCVDSSDNLVAIGFNDGSTEVWELGSTRLHVLLIRRVEADDVPLGDAQAITQVKFASNYLITTTAVGIVEVWQIEKSFAQLPSALSRSEAPASSSDQYYGMGRSSPNSMVRTRMRTPVPSSLSPTKSKTHRRTRSGGAVICLDKLVTEDRASPKHPSSSADMAPPTHSQRPRDKFNILEDDGTICTFTRVFSLKCHGAMVVGLEVLGDWIITASADGTVKIIRMGDFTVKHELTGHEAAISCLCVYSGPARIFSKAANARGVCENVIVTGSVDRTIRLWGLDDAECRAVLTGHTGVITRVRANGEFVASMSDDETLRIFNRHSLACLRVLHISSPHLTMVLHPSSILVTAAEGVLTAWDLLAGGERVRTVKLKSPMLLQHDTLPLGGAEDMMLVGDTVVCTHAASVKLIRLPFPLIRDFTKTK